jgi:hypothetical protein
VALDVMWAGSAILGGGFDEDVIRLGLAQRKVIAANLDFDRIAERRSADESDARPGQQTHFAETNERRSRFGKLTDRRRRANGQVRQLDGLSHGRKNVGRPDCSGAADELLNQDVFGSVVVEGDPVAVDGAQEWPAPANFSDHR